MEVGDIVLYNGKRWKVASHSASYRTVVLASFDGTKVEVPDDLDHPVEDAPPDHQGVSVLFNPAKSWPVASAAVRSKAGPVVGVIRDAVGLSPLTDWVPSDFLRPGPIFFNPKLRLRQGEVLALVHKDGSRSRLPITKAFGTIRKRQIRVTNPPKPMAPKTNLDRLLTDDMFEDL